MNKTLHRIIAWTAFLLGAALCPAQTASGSTPAPASVTFTAMAWDVFDPDQELELNYLSRGQPRTFQAAWRGRSQPLECDGAGPLVFTRTVEQDGEKIEVPVTTADIPVGATRVLLVFGRVPNPAPGAPAMRVLVIDDSHEIFPGQSVRFLNYSRMTFGGSLGEQRFEVSPGGDRVVPAALPEPNRLLPFRLARRDDQGGWQKLRSTGLPMSDGLRVLVFLIENPARPGRPEMVMIRDRVPPPAALAPDTSDGPVFGLRVNSTGR